MNTLVKSAANAPVQKFNHSVIIPLLHLADPSGRARSEAKARGLSLARILVSNSGGVMDVCLLKVVYWVEISTTGRSLIQRSPTDCLCVVECDQGPQ